jgi:hypothetical protein
MSNSLFVLLGSRRSHEASEGGRTAYYTIISEELNNTMNSWLQWKTFLLDDIQIFCVVTDKPEMLTINLTAAPCTCRNGGLFLKIVKGWEMYLDTSKWSQWRTYCRRPALQPARQEFFVKLTKKISIKNRVVIRSLCNGCLQSEWF